MQMGTGCIAGLTDTGNLAAAADFFSHLDGNAAAMRIQRRKSVRMIDDQVLSVARLSGLTDRSVGKRLDRRALIGRYVHAVVKSRLTGERTQPLTERRCKRALRRENIMKADRIDSLVRRVRELRLLTSEDVVRTARGCRVSRITADRRGVFRPSAEDTECFLHSRRTGKRLSRPCTELGRSRETAVLDHSSRKQA